jgi:hypothetical protein
MKKLKWLVSLIFVIGPLFVLGQQAPSSDTLLDHMTGKWLLRGIIAGNKIEHDILIGWVLGHQYIELKETSREKQADGMPLYDALVLMSRDNSKNQYNCLWLDNTSNIGLSNGVMAHAAFEPNTIAFLFKLNDHNYFHTTFTYNATNDSWHWEMTNDEDGKIEPFADAVMSRLP